MADFFKTIDRVGKEFKFTIDGKESFKTIIGGVISLFYYMGLIALFFYFGRDLYQKTDPNFLTRQDVLNEYNFKNINDNNFFISFSLFNGINSVYNLSYFDVFTEYYSIDKTDAINPPVNPIPTIAQHKNAATKL